MSVKIAEFPKATDQRIAEQTERIERALADCKAGKYETVLIIGLTNDDHIGVMWTACQDMLLLLGQLERLKHITQKRMDGAYEDQADERPPAA